MPLSPAKNTSRPCVAPCSWRSPTRRSGEPPPQQQAPAAAGANPSTANLLPCLPRFKATWTAAPRQQRRWRQPQWRRGRRTSSCEPGQPPDAVSALAGRIHTIDCKCEHQRAKQERQRGALRGAQGNHSSTKRPAETQKQVWHLFMTAGSPPPWPALLGPRPATCARRHPCRGPSRNR